MGSEAGVVFKIPQFCVVSVWPIGTEANLGDNDSRLTFKDETDSSLLPPQTGSRDTSLPCTRCLPQEEEYGCEHERACRRVHVLVRVCGFTSL